MTAELYNKTVPIGIVFVMAHLMPLATTPNPQDSVVPKRWSAGMPLPCWAVTGLGGPTDFLADHPRIRVHTFGATYTDAMLRSWDAHQRMMLLLNNPLYDVVMPDGSIANCESLDAPDSPHEEPYAASSVVTRFVAEYLPVLRFT